jgi:pilus assembly protein FimV
MRVSNSPRCCPPCASAVEKKPNGKAVLKVTSSRPVNDPFIDMLVELNWASGRLVREYTMLLDPPGMAARKRWRRSP